MHSDRRGTDKKHPGQNLPDKRQNPRTKTPRTNEGEFVHGAFVRFFVLGLLKMGGGSEICDVLLGVPGCVTKCDRERGVKIGQNSVTYFIDGPYDSSHKIAEADP